MQCAIERLESMSECRILCLAEENCLSALTARMRYENELLYGLLKYQQNTSLLISQDRIYDALYFLLIHWNVYDAGIDEYFTCLYHQIYDSFGNVLL